MCKWLRFTISREGEHYKGVYFCELNIPYISGITCQECGGIGMNKKVNGL